MTELQQTAAPLDRDSLIQEIALTNQVSVPWEELRQTLKERLDQVFESKQLVYTASTVTNPLTTTLAPLPPTSTAVDFPDPSLTSTSEQPAKDTSVRDHSQDQVPEQSEEAGPKTVQDLESRAAGAKDDVQSNSGQTAASTEQEAQGQAEGQTPMPTSVDQEEETKASHGPESVDLNGKPSSIIAAEQPPALSSNMVPVSKDTLLVETPEGYHERINGLLDTFTSAPFTIQRVCELLSNPTEHHSNLIKYLRAVEKVLMITSSIYEFSNPAYNGPSALDEDTADEDKTFAEGINGDYAGSADLDFSLIATSAVPPLSETGDQDGQNGVPADNVEGVVGGADEVHPTVSDGADASSLSAGAEKEPSADMDVDSENTSTNATTMDGVETAAETEKASQENESSDIQVDADADNSMELDQTPITSSPGLLQLSFVMAPTPIDPSALYSGSLLSLIVLILDLMAIIQVLNSDRPVLSKLLWCLLIFLCPIVGIIIY
ncbi:protein phosphatase 4, regulatory subunit 2 [Mortierella alpina]|nr:protein phosphatase 4, regulatory subunit 2 [Mortierella alpina]